MRKLYLYVVSRFRRDSKYIKNCEDSGVWRIPPTVINIVAGSTQPRCVIGALAFTRRARADPEFFRFNYILLIGFSIPDVVYSRAGYFTISSIDFSLAQKDCWGADWLALARFLRQCV